MNAKVKLTWMLAIAAVIALLPVVWSLARAQTDGGSGIQAPGNDTAAPVPEAPLPTNDVPRTPPSEAQIEEQLGATATGSAFLVLPPAAFSSDGDIPTGFFIAATHGYFDGQIDYGACVVAPVLLPDGVVLSSFEVRLNDNNSNMHEWFSLYRTDIQTGATSEIATVQSPSGVTWGIVPYVDNTITNPIVSDMYTYSILTCTRPSIYVYSVRIGYSAMVHMPFAAQEYP